MNQELPKPKKLKRPQETEGKTTRIETGCGHLYVTIGKDNGNVVEVFATLGKSGGCAKAQGEAITRSLSLGLKYGIPLKEFIEEFDNIRCPCPGMDSGNPVFSCADAIAKVLKKELKNEPNARATTK